MIDQVVKLYPGTYTHDEVFYLPWITVQNLIVMNKKQAYIHSRAQGEQRRTKN